MDDGCLDVKEASPNPPTYTKYREFLDVEGVIDILKNPETILPAIPTGIKENTFFIIDNTENIRRKSVGKRCFILTTVVRGKSPRARVHILFGTVKI